MYIQNNIKMEPLLNFLKKYSDVEIQFIRDFMNIQESDRIRYPFNIDLEIVAKWLQTRKGDLKETLIKSYEEKIDYIILNIDLEELKSRRGGQNKERILLTNDTFKLLTLRSKTKLAERIRYYYITLEKCIKLLLQNEEYRNRKEFYVMELADVITAIKDCDQLIKNFKCKSCKKTDTINNIKSHFEDNHNKDEKIRFYGIKWSRK